MSKILRVVLTQRRELSKDVHWVVGPKGRKQEGSLNRHPEFFTAARRGS